MIEEAEAFGLLSVATLVMGDLAFRGVVDRQQLRSDLLGKAQLWQETHPPLGDALLTAALLEFGAENMTDDDANAGRKFSWEMFKAAFLALPENERDQGGPQIALGLLELWNMTVAALIGRGLLEGHNLRRELLGMSRLEEQHGHSTSAALIRCVADRVEKMNEAIELGRKYPPVAGRA